jgi:hypothetical protein
MGCEPRLPKGMQKNLPSTDRFVAGTGRLS